MAAITLIAIPSPGKSCYDVGRILTLTAVGCGMGPVIAEDVKRLVSHLPEMQQIDFEFIFDPPWERSMMSEEAQLELALM
jgi:metal-sulfur cluster biosynthetic enzyme